jgi:hypothetical protein
MMGHESERRTLFFLWRISRKFYVLRITMHTKKKRKENENGTSVEERNKERER